VRGPVRSGKAAGLDYDVSVTEGAGDGTTVAVLLHGRGSHKGDLQALGPVLPADWTIVTPQAPFPGMPWGYGPGWAWYRYVGENRLVEETMEESLGLLEDFLGALPETLGFEPGRVVLGGFSQGGTMSIAYAMSHPGAVVAALNFSGFVAANVELPTGEAAASATPIFWGHGTSDPAIPFHMAVSGRDALSAAGVPFVAVDYPIGHWIVPEEIHEAVAMVEALP
jgi:phospholipase/carboxylesterase